jgi:hypothetical protein
MMNHRQINLFAAASRCLLHKALTGALRQFRSRAAQSGEPLVLWTDAVCINQLDVDERSQQVAMMQRVFESAASVLIWLGEGDAIAESGLLNLLGLAMYQQVMVTDPVQAPCVFDCHDFDAKPDLEYIRQVDTIFRSFGKPGGFDGHRCENVREMGPDMVSWVTTISALLDLSYWYRGWTFQEACVNERVFLHYGKVRCRVNDWSSLWEYMIQNGDLFGWLEHHKALTGKSDFVSWIFAAHSVSSQAKLSKEFPPTTPYLDSDTMFEMLGLDLHTVARPVRRTTDPRDQVYSQMCVNPGLRLLELRPDYTMTTEQVFTTTTLAILQVSQSWGHRQFFTPSESPFMPSWVIDFTLAPDPDISHLDSLFLRGKFNAHSGALFQLQESQPGSIITAGFMYDEVVTFERWDRFGHERTFFDVALAIIRNEDASDFLRNGTCPTSKDFWESFSRTLCMGTVDGAQFGPQHVATCHGLLDRHWPPVLNEMAAREHFAQRKGMSFIVTRNGHLGMVSSNVNVGDRIAVLAGGCVPFILRKVGESDNGESHIMIGGCYVDGESFTSSVFVY